MRRSGARSPIATRSSRLPLRADENAERAARLAGEVETSRSASEALHGQLSQVEERRDELERLRNEATGEAEELRSELAAQQELIQSLEAELKAKQATVDLLERNVQRITRLGASLSALDRQMAAGPSAAVEPHGASEAAQRT